MVGKIILKHSIHEIRLALQAATRGFYKSSLHIHVPKIAESILTSCAIHSDTAPWTYLGMKYRNTALASSVLQDLQQSFSFFNSQLEGYYSPTTPASAIPRDHDVPNAVVCCWF